mmetsp:Transcript_68808/g.165164  ORF Transcript_68808/g.165164 Transcript_68808/m.165164 type:complete len:228 (-) Transcript_68808:62-745(-)
MDAAAAAGAPMPPPPEVPWAGAVSSKWGAGLNGKERRVKQVATSLRSGLDGIAAQGLAGYFTDVHRRDQERLAEGPRRVASSPSLTSFNDEHRQFQWRAARRQVETIQPAEPHLLTKRPPFVPRHGQNIRLPAAQPLPPDYDAAVERWLLTTQRQAVSRQAAKEMEERQQHRTMLRGLETWEKEKLGKSQDDRGDAVALLMKRTNKPANGYGDSRFEFSRNRRPHEG